MMTRLPPACSAATCWSTASNTLPPGSAPLGSEVTPLFGAGVDHRPLPFRDRERREQGQRRARQPVAPVYLTEIEPVRRQRLVGRTWSALGKRVLPCIIIVLDLPQPLARSVLGERFQHDGRARHIIQQRVELVVKEWQPVSIPG